MKVVVTLPTYNERENVGELIGEIHRHAPEFFVLVIDDESPDGTAELVEEMAAGDERVHILKRTGPRGRGRAGIAGFMKALRLGADAVVEMDADFQHDPRDAPRLVEALAGADVVIGSRLVAGGRQISRPLYRRVVTRFSCAYAGTVLGLPVRDANSGFRAFRREVLESIGLSTLVSTGPSLVHEVLYRAARLGFTLRETPIVFNERGRGHSKLSARLLAEGFLMAARFRLDKKALGELDPS